MRRLLLIPAALLLACHNSHPREVVGAWVSDSVRGGVLRIVDTLELDAGGEMRVRGALWRYIAPGRGAIDTSVTHMRPVRGQWEITRNDDGRYLCMTDSIAGRRCAHLSVIPETQLMINRMTYRRLR